MLLEKLVIPIGFDTGLLLEGINAIKGLITGAVERTAEWAESLDKLGDVTGMSTDNLAAWSYAAQKAGVDTGIVSRSAVILAKGLVDASGQLDTTGKSLAAFGVNVFDANGKVKEQSILMADVSKKYAELGTQTQRVDFLTSIFGRSGAELIDVFDTMAQAGGIDMVKQKVQELGLVLDPAQYENFQRSLNEVQLTTTGLANAFTAQLMPGAEKLLGIFTTWLQSPWVASAIKGIGDQFGLLVSDFALGIETGNFDKFWADLKISIDAGFVALGDIGAWVDWLVATWMQKLEYSIVNWTSQGGPQKLADQLLGWIDGVGEFPIVQSKIVTGMEGLVRALADAMAKVDWSALDKALADRFRTWFGGEFDKLTAWAGEKMTSFLSGIAPTANGSYSNATGRNALGMPTYTKKASGGSAGGLTWVGERGPELLNLPNGSNITRASDSAAQAQIDYDQMGKSVARHLVPALQAAGLG